MSGVMNDLGSEGFPSQLSFLMVLSFLSLAGVDDGSAAPTPKAGSSVAMRLVNALLLNRLENIASPVSWFLRQSKTENVAARSDGHVLLTSERVTHRRGVNALASGEVPQRLAGLRLHSLERLGVISK